MVLSRPAEHAEKALVEAILDGTYPSGSALPAERSLAQRLGVTRPTLREALQRLNRDGWLQIRHGKPTRVNDFWWHGGLGVLSAVVRQSRSLPPGFVPNLLEVRSVLAPAYARAAVERSPDSVSAYLEQSLSLEDGATAFARYDWGLHKTLARASENPVYSLILNGFGGLYEQMARHYFAKPKGREASRHFYRALHRASRRRAAASAERVTREAMQKSLELWRRVDRRLGASP